MNDTTVTDYIIEEDYPLITKHTTETDYITKENYQYNYPLHISVRKKNMKHTTKLLKRGIDINKYDVYGKPPIYYANKQHILLLVSKLSLDLSFITNKILLARESGCVSSIEGYVSSGLHIRHKTFIKECEKKSNFTKRIYKNLRNIIYEYSKEEI